MIVVRYLTLGKCMGVKRIHQSTFNSLKMLSLGLSCKDLRNSKEYIPVASRSPVTGGGADECFEPISNSCEARRHVCLTRSSINDENLLMMYLQMLNCQIILIDYTI